MRRSSGACGAFTTSPTAPSSRLHLPLVRSTTLHRPREPSVSSEPSRKLDTREDVPTVAVLFIDVDELKAVNDRFGHIFGDRVLIRVAAVLRDGAGPRCTLVRLEGDEFAVRAHDVKQESEAIAIAECLLEVFAEAEALNVDDTKVEVPLSICIALGSLRLSRSSCCITLTSRCIRPTTRAPTLGALYSDSSTIGQR